MSLAEVDEASAYRLDWLLAIEDTVAEVEAEQMQQEASSSSSSSSSSSTLPNGMREVRINYRELEAEP